jgi:hypothetical protein
MLFPQLHPLSDEGAGAKNDDKCEMSVSKVVGHGDL